MGREVSKMGNHLLYKCPEEHRFQAAGKEREKDWEERGWTRARHG